MATGTLTLGANDYVAVFFSVPEHGSAFLEVHAERPVLTHVMTDGTYIDYEDGREYQALGWSMPRCCHKIWVPSDPFGRWCLTIANSEEEASAIHYRFDEEFRVDIGKIETGESIKRPPNTPTPAAPPCSHPEDTLVVHVGLSPGRLATWCSSCGSIRDGGGDHGAPPGTWRSPARPPSRS
jgi:hypothetical protein